MCGGASAFADAVCAVWITHHLELPAIFDQFVDQHFCSLVVYIIVAGAMNNQEISLEIFCVSDRRTFDERLFIFLWQTHISFLVDIIIQELIGYRAIAIPVL